jgi:O-antigen ligase
MTRYSAPIPSLPAGTFVPPRLARPATEYHVPAIAVWAYIGFFLFSFFNVAGMVVTLYKLGSMPVQPVMFAATCMLVIPWTRSKPTHPYFVVAGVFCTMFAVGGFLGPHPQAGVSDKSLWELIVKLWISLIGVPFLTIRAIDRDKLPMLVKIAVVSAVIAALFSVVQVVRPGPFAILMSEPGRGSGFWINPNSCALVLGFCLFLSLAYPFRSKGLNLTLRGILVLGMLSTLSRTGLAMLVIGFAVYGIAAKRVWTVLQIGVMLLVVALVGSSLVNFLKTTGSKSYASRLQRFGSMLQGDMSSKDQGGDRIILWQYGWRAIMREPILGHGHRFMDNVVPIGNGFGPHNYYLYVWGNSGILALLALLAFFLMLVRMSWQCTDAKSRAALLAIATMIMAVAMVDHSFLSNLFFGPIFAIMVTTAYYLKPQKKVGGRSMPLPVRVVPPRGPGGRPSTTS